MQPYTDSSATLSPSRKVKDNKNHLEFQLYHITIIFNEHYSNIIFFLFKTLTSVCKSVPPFYNSFSLSIMTQLTESVCSRGIDFYQIFKQFRNFQFVFYVSRGVNQADSRTQLRKKMVSTF